MDSPINISKIKTTETISESMENIMQNGNGLNKDTETNMESQNQGNTQKPTVIFTFEELTNAVKNMESKEQVIEKMNTLINMETTKTTEINCTKTKKTNANENGQEVTTDDGQCSNGHGPKTIKKEKMKVQPIENIMEFVMKNPIIREYETIHGYLRVRQNFIGFDQWKYSPPNMQAKKMYDELTSSKLSLHKTIYYVLQLMKMSLGLNDFDIPMHVYQAIMDLKGDKHLMSERSYTLFEKQIHRTVNNTSNSTIWSNHKNFDPYKRVQYRFNRTEMPKITTFDEFLSIAENYGLLKESQNFKLIHSHDLVIRFNGQNYNSTQVSKDLLMEISNSFYGQNMDAKALIQTASIMATIKLLIFTPKYNHYEDILVNFINQIVDMLRQLTISVALKEIVSLLLSNKHLIPVSTMDLKNYITIDGEFIKSLFVAKTIKIETRADAEIVEAEEGILVRGNQIKFELGETTKININMGAVKQTHDIQIVKLIVEELEKTTKLCQSISKGYEYSKTIEYVKPTFDPVLGRNLPKSKITTEEKTFSDVTYIHLTDVLTKFTFVNDNHPGLSMHVSDILSEYGHDDLLKLSMVKNDQLLDSCLNNFPKVTYHLKLREKYGRSIAYYLQLNVQDVYSNIEELRRLVKHLAMLASEHQSIPVPIKEESKEAPKWNRENGEYENESFEDIYKYPFRLLNSHYNKVKGTASSIFDTVTSIDKTKEKVEETMAAIKETALKFSEKLDSTNMTNTASLITSSLTADFNGISSVFSTVKIMMSAVFNDIANKIGSIFGLEINSNVDAYQLFVYYLLWKNTNCTITKTFIILDIMASFGILDKAWEILTWIFRKTTGLVKGLFTFDDYNNEVNEKILNFGSKTQQILATEVIRKPKEEVTQEDELNFLERLFKQLESGTPAFLALVGTAALVAFGCKNINEKNCTERFVKSMKTVALLGVSFTSLPKIYQGLIHVINFVIDQLKGIILRDHETELSLVKRFGKFLKDALYMPNMSETVMMSDLKYCFKFMEHYAEMIALNRELHRIKDVALRQTFVTRMNMMEKLASTAEAAISILLPKQEMFHTQVTSQPGLGKTDLSYALMYGLYEERELQKKNAMEAMGIDYVPKNTGFSYYPANDSLKFMDNYKGQEIMYVDEANISAEMELDKILMDLMMASGSPVISNQASLNDKGRILNVAIKVSNTNNPFVKPLGFLCPEALWRRRHLFRAVPKKIYTTEGRFDKSKVTTQMMSTSQHLEIIWLNNSKDEVNSEAPMPVMEVDDFIALARILYKNHFTTHFNRANIKAPESNYMAMRHMSNMVHIHNTMSEMVDIKKLKEDAKMNQAILKADRETPVPQEVKDLPQNVDPDNVDDATQALIDKAIEAKQALLNRIETLQGILLEKASKEEKVKLEAMLKSASATSLALNTTTADGQAILETIKEMSEVNDEGYLDFNTEFINYGLVKKTIDCKEYYTLEPTERRHPMKKGKVNWGNIKILEVDGVKRVVYEVDENTDEQNVLYHLLDLSTYSERGIKAKLLLAYEREQVGKKKLQFAARLRVMIEDTYRVVSGALASIGRKIYNIISEGFFRGVVLTLSVLVMFGTLGGIASLLKGKDYEDNAQYTSRNRVTKKNVGSYYGEAELKNIPEPSDDLMHLYKSMVKIQLNNGDRQMSGVAVSIDGYVFMTNKHISDNICPTTVIYVCDMHKVETDQEKAWTRVNHGKIVDIPDCDLSLVVIRDYRMLKSSLKHFLTEEDYKDALETFGNARLKPLLACDKQCPGTNGMHRHEGEWSEFWISSTNRHKRVCYYRKPETGRGPTPGDSGSLVIHNNNRLEHKIMGLHCGTPKLDPYMSVCGVVTQEEIISTLRKIPEEDRIQTHPFDGDYLVEHELSSVIKYPHTLMVSPINNQSVSKSLGYSPTGCFVDKIESEPAIQSDKDHRIVPGLRHHMQVSLNKDNGDSRPYISIEEEKIAIRFATALLKENWNWQTVRLYTVEQAVNGVKKNGSRPIEIHTSAGWPYKERKGVIGKQPMIVWSEEQQRYITKKEILDDVSYKKSLFKSGITSRDYKVEFRKHEIVGLSKIYEKPKTRTVGMGNMVDQIIYDTVFKDMHTGIKSVWKEGKHSFCAMGVDMEKHGQQIADRLRWIEQVMDFDVVAWEEKFTRQLGRMTLQAKLELIKEAYRINNCPLPEKLELMVLTLLDDSMFSNVIYEDTIRTRLSGLLSGWPGTAPDNSAAHAMILFIIVYRILLVKQQNLATVPYIMQNVRFVLLSDDICLSLSPGIRMYVTEEDIQNGYKILGYDITAPDKTPKIKSRPITEVEFLKHYFVRTKKDGILSFTTKIMPKVIYQLLAYVRTSSKLPVKQQMQINVADAMRFAYWHGEEFYEKLRTEVNHQFAKFQISWNTNFTEMEIIIRHLQDTEEAITPTRSVECEFYEDNN
uniref:SF3 helicase domain-containing protein n=1 Tax=Sichuan mosquito picorna-like virus TaxID=2863998 RepID=A0A8K1M4T6_9VIRU|nr:hypothetical protein 3 [Sichuan mosquito picorna-like virus]